MTQHYFGEWVRRWSLRTLSMTFLLETGCALPEQHFATQRLSAQEVGASDNQMARVVYSKSAVIRQYLMCFDGHTFNPSTDVVAPGRHYISIEVNSMNLRGLSKLWFTAEAGHIYEIQSQIDLRGIRGNTYRTSIVDRQSGSEIGGAQGSEPAIASDPKHC